MPSASTRCGCGPTGPAGVVDRIVASTSSPVSGRRASCVLSSASSTTPRTRSRRRTSTPSSPSPAPVSSPRACSSRRRSTGTVRRSRPSPARPSSRCHASVWRICSARRSTGTPSAWRPPRSWSASVARRCASTRSERSTPSPRVWRQPTGASSLWPAAPARLSPRCASPRRWPALAGGGAVPRPLYRPALANAA